MKVILPSAGYATRLYPLTQNMPKALLEIGGRPIIEHILEKINKIPDVSEIIIVANEKFYGRFVQWRAALSTSAQLTIINDFTKSNDERLGAVRDILLAVEQKPFRDDVLVINSDNFFSFSLTTIADLFKFLRKTVIGLFTVGELSMAKQLGTVKVDEYGRIIFFKEKNQKAESCLCSVGIYFFPKEVIELLHTYLEKGNSPEGIGNFIEWLSKRVDVYGHEFNNRNDYWFDIGTPESYALAIKYLSSLLLKK